MKRDYYLDFLRGIAALNIIIIHTAFWSGEGYVPTIIKNLTLLLDVPFFFFLSGWSSTYSKSIRRLNGLAEIQKKYIFFLIIYTLLLSIFSKEDISALNFIYNLFYINNINSKLFPVVMGSIWFMPVYFTVSCIFIENYLEKQTSNLKYLYLLIFFFIGFIYTQLGYNFFNISINILFYSFFYTLGIISRNYKVDKLIKLVIIIVIDILLIIFFKHIFGIKNIVIQNLKFPPHILYLLISMISVFIAMYFKGKIVIKKSNCISKIGKNAIFYYFAQGISSSLIIFIVNKINYIWYFKFLIIVCVNIVATIIIAELLSLIYKFTINLISKFNKIKICFNLFEKDTIN